MNLDNLEDLKESLTNLGFPKTIAEEMEKNMKLELPEFHLKYQIKGESSPVDMDLIFKKSGKSDYYYFNKYEAVMSYAKPLDDDKKYLVISTGGGGKPVFRKFDATHEAIKYFKSQTGTSELAIGKDPANKQTVATMENGSVNKVEKPFRDMFRVAPKTQNIYIREGAGFTAEQAANLLQGRSVFREDMLSTSGEAYKAWINLDFDKPKDNYGNFKTKQFNEAYGFDINKALNNYQLKELADPKKIEMLEESLKNGNRVQITTMINGENVKLKIEASPRYQQINFFRQDGRPEKREQFMTPEALAASEAKKASKEKTFSQQQEMAR